MSDTEIQHFLITYDINASKATVREFGDNYDAALDAYEKLEQDARDREDLDIVLVGADSIETVARTHSSYFKTETFESMLPPGVLVV